MARRIRLVLGGRSTLRPFLLAVSCFATVLSLDSSVIAAEGTTWVVELDVAVRQAREQKKLLIVVDFAEDFTRDSGTSRSQNSYSAVTLADRRCRQLLDSWFVLVRRNVGDPASISATLPIKERKVEAAEYA